MPYRRLPNTDSARLRAMQSALQKSETIPPFKLAYSASTYQELKYFLPEFIQAMEYQRETLARQTEKSKIHSEALRKARLYISHFIQVLNFAIIRGELKTDTKSFFDMEIDDKKLPQLNTEKDVIMWGELLIKGEQKRLAIGQAPITNPTIARVKVHFEEFLRIHKSQKYLQETHAKSIEKMSVVRDKADEIILKIWNEVEEYYSNMDAAEKREHSSDYGLNYVYRKNEKMPFDKIKLDQVS